MMNKIEEEFKLEWTSEMCDYDSELESESRYEDDKDLFRRIFDG